MKRVILLLVLIFCIPVFADVSVFTGDNNKFGLKDSKGNVIVEPEYKKLIRLGNSAWIMQKGNRFGIIHDTGKVIVEPRFNQAERVLGKYAKFRKGDKYGIYDEMGFEILPPEYSSIDLLYGGMFVTSKNYMYGITDLNGMLILDNIFEDIYMPDFSTLILVHNDSIIEVKREPGQDINLPFDFQTINENSNIVGISDLASSPLASTGYYGITATDYILKLISSISPSYEETIDELMFSQGADTVSVLVRCSWIPKFPFIYAKNYFKNVKNPYNGPLSKTKKTLKKKIKN